MNSSLLNRRETLVAQIESQRLELGQAYRQLEKPIHYGEFALQGFGFLRRNPWIAMAAPGVTGLLFSGIGALLRRGKAKGELKIDRAKLLEEFKADEAKAKKPLMKYIGYGVTLLKLYRRLRPFFL